jgi:hypothetical protein
VTPSGPAIPEKPILFSGAMVKAILAGQKSQTRRTCSSARWWRHVDFVAGRGDSKDDPENWGYADEYGDYWTLKGQENGGSGELPCPYGRRGTRLWVRETFALESNYDLDSADAYPPPHADGRPIKWTDDDDHGRVWHQPHYRATDPEPHIVCDDDKREDGDDLTRWRPSIFMPRWASRITLEITDVRVQRVAEISEEDAIAEGIAVDECHHVVRADGLNWGGARGDYAVLWESINGKRPGCSWADNPFVWAISFQVSGPAILSQGDGQKEKKA